MNKNKLLDSLYLKSNELEDKAFYKAVSDNNLDELQVLIESKINLEQEFRDCTPLGLAAYLGYIEVIKTLLGAGANPNGGSDSPLNLAAKIGKTRLEIIQVLLEAGADPNLSKKTTGATPLMYAVGRGSNKVIKLLLDYGANINSRDCSDGTAIMIAVAKGRIDLVQMLINEGAEINIIDDHRYSVLDLAYQNNKPKIIQLLESLGAKTGAEISAF